MWGDSWRHEEMMNWSDGGWHWVFGFHGLISLLFIAIFIIVGISFMREFRQKKSERSYLDHNQGSIDPPSKP